MIVTHAKNRHGTVYPYFICIGRHQKRTNCTRKALLTSAVEELIEDFYAEVELSGELRQQIETHLRDELAALRESEEKEYAALAKKEQLLLHQRDKLLQAHYAGAIALDQLKSEQDRFSGRLDQVRNRSDARHTEFDRIERNLKLALDFAWDCQRPYVEADPPSRRQLNQALSRSCSSTR